MSDPVMKPNTSGYPEESLVRRYRNILIQFKKTLQSTTDIRELQQEMEHFLNINRQVIWPHQTSGIFRKDEAEKAVDKVVTEYQRYVKDLKHHDSPSTQDLLDALLMVESMLGKLKDGI